MSTTKTRRTGLVKVGEVGVDAGMVMVGDPCYLARFVKNSPTSHGGEHFDVSTTDMIENSPDGAEHAFSYLGACNASLSEARGGELGGGDAVCVSSGYGDGVYPVFIQYDDNGHVACLIVEFNGESEDEGEDEDEYRYDADLDEDEDDVSDL